MESEEAFRDSDKYSDCNRHMVAENNLVMVFLNGSGTHKGEIRGSPPTNKQVNIRSADLYEIENEIITGHWDVVDQLNLLQTNWGVTFRTHR